MRCFAAVLGVQNNVKAFFLLAVTSIFWSIYTSTGFLSFVLQSRYYSQVHLPHSIWPKYWDNLSWLCSQQGICMVAFHFLWIESRDQRPAVTLILYISHVTYVCTMYCVGNEIVSCSSVLWIRIRSLLGWSDSGRSDKPSRNTGSWFDLFQTFAILYDFLPKCCQFFIGFWFKF